jgi:hypothetical protein
VQRIHVDVLTQMPTSGRSARFLRRACRRAPPPSCRQAPVINFFSVDMRVLRSFVSVVETGSMTETARRLGRTQPAITLQMKRLEDLTGRELFKPDSRRPVLTDEGRMVLSYAKSILRLHDELWGACPRPTSRVMWCWARPICKQRICCRPSSRCSASRFPAAIWCAPASAVRNDASSRSRRTSVLCDARSWTKQ